MQPMPNSTQLPMRQKPNFQGPVKSMRDYFNGDIHPEDTPALDSDPYVNRTSLQSTIGVNDWKKPAGPQFSNIKASNNTIGGTSRPDDRSMKNAPQSMTRSQRYFNQEDNSSSQGMQSQFGNNVAKQPAGAAPAVHQPSFRSGMASRGEDRTTQRNKDGWKDEANLRFQIDIQISPKKMLIVKIYEGDKAEDILANLTSNKDLELDEEDIVNIERVVRHHTTH